LKASPSALFTCLLVTYRPLDPALVHVTASPYSHSAGSLFLPSHGVFKPIASRQAVAACVACGISCWAEGRRSPSPQLSTSCHFTCLESLYILDLWRGSERHYSSALRVLYLAAERCSTSELLSVLDTQLQMGVSR